jgi:hypothetical protein
MTERGYQIELLPGVLVVNGERVEAVVDHDAADVKIIDSPDDDRETLARRAFAAGVEAGKLMRPMMNR